MIHYKRHFSSASKLQQGFTILELTIVILIMGILTSLTVVNVLKSQVTARDKERADDVSSIARDFESLYNQGLNSSDSSLSSYNQPLSYPSTLLISSSDSDVASAVFDDITPASLQAPNGTDGTPSTGCGGTSSTYADQTVTGTTGSGGIWGSCPYTNDSSVAKAAVHAGLISAGQTATIRVYQLPDQGSYTGSTKNGVTTANYGAWNGSISLELPGTGNGVAHNLVNATNTTKATASNVSPMPSASNDVYVYQPLNRDDTLCTSTTITFYPRPDPTHCVKFQIFYYDEESQSVQVKNSINQ